MQACASSSQHHGRAQNPIHVKCSRLPVRVACLPPELALQHMAEVGVQAAVSNRMPELGGVQAFAVHRRQTSRQPVWQCCVATFSSCRQTISFCWTSACVHLLAVCTTCCQSFRPVIWMQCLHTTCRCLYGTTRALDVLHLLSAWWHAFTSFTVLCRKRRHGSLQNDDALLQTVGLLRGRLRHQVQAHDADVAALSAQLYNLEQEQGGWDFERDALKQDLRAKDKQIEQLRRDVRQLRAMSSGRPVVDDIF